MTNKNWKYEPFNDEDFKNISSTVQELIMDYNNNKSIEDLVKVNDWTHWKDLEKFDDIKHIVFHDQLSDSQKIDSLKMLLGDDTNVGNTK